MEEPRVSLDLRSAERSFSLGFRSAESSFERVTGISIKGSVCMTRLYLMRDNSGLLEHDRELQAHIHALPLPRA